MHMHANTYIILCELYSMLISKMTANTITYPKKYFKYIIQRILWVGLPVSEDQKLKTVHWTRFALLYTSACFYTCTEWIHLYKHFDELEVVTFACCYIFTHILAIIKVSILLTRRKEVNRLFRLLESGNFLPDLQRGGMQEIDIISGAIRSTNNNVMRFIAKLRMFGIFVSTVVVAGALPYIRNGRVVTDISVNVTKIVASFPFPSTLPFEYDNTTSPNYELTVTFQVFNIGLYGGWLGSTDSLNVGLIIHATAQFKILINALETAASRARKMIDVKVTPGVYEIQETNQVLRNAEFLANFRMCIKRCARHHQDIINLVQSIEDYLSDLVLMQFLLSLFGIVVGLYQVSVAPQHSPIIISISTFCLIVMFMVFIYCVNGNQMSDYSTQVATAAYNCNWEDGDDDIRKAVLLIIARAQRGCYLTSGKFSNVSLETFIAIIKGAFSYYTFLQGMGEEAAE